MRINEVRTREADVTLNADELVMIHNMLYFYSRFHHMDPDASKPGQRFHELYIDVNIAKDLCQYGHLDSFSIDQLIMHSIMANPIQRMQQVQRAIDAAQRKDEQL